MALTIHRAQRSDVLVRRLGDVLADAPADPFTPDVVAVPSRGVERWLAQSLSTRLGSGSDAASAARSDGVCANVLFPSPGRLVRDALAAACGVDPDQDPWSERRLVWPVLEVVDDCAHEDWCRTLGRHLGAVGPRPAAGSPVGPAPARRVAVAQKLAGLYTAYAAERPGMLLDWVSGRDTDGYDGPLAADLVWQAELWRRVRARLGTESIAERLGPGCRTLRERPEVVDLPDRVSVFGPTRLTTQQLDVLDALAARREVHLWLPHPSEDLWQRLAAGVGTAAVADAGAGHASRRRDDPSAQEPRHPLIRSLGRDAREMQLRLQAHTVPGAEEHLPVPDVPDTLLGALQRDLRADRAPRRAHLLADDDTSITVHACHGRHRQVEVLREVLLGLLADDRTLELRDIIVMCPDVEAYAPLISAVFGAEVTAEEGAGLPQRREHQPHPGHQLTFRLADRSLHQTNPVLGVLARLLDLADSRLTASEVLDLIALPPVRRKFHLAEDELERVGDWVHRAGVRWGLDARTRAPYGLAAVDQNTWRHGLDRILLGVAVEADSPDGPGTVGGAVPLGDVDSTDVDLAGRLAELLDRLDATLGALTGEQPLHRWAAVLSEAVDALTEVAPGEDWQLGHAQAALADVVATAEGAGQETTLRLADVRALLGARLAGRPTRANFRTGHLTVCTMVPMRSVPHRVVCLLGLDDGVFPRSARLDGDDVLARDPRVGERDQRSEDRELFLDAILAARDRLVVLYTGADERTGVARPPAVPLGELLDVLDRTATTDVRDRVVTHHPLQPFDPRNFAGHGPAPAGGVLAREVPFSFDAASHAGSVALSQGQLPRAAFLDAPLPSPDEAGTVSLEALAQFLEHPVRGFLRERLEVRTAGEPDEPPDDLPVTLEKLERYKVGDRLLRAGLGGATREDARRAERLRGELPPGRLGDAALEPILTDVDGLLHQCRGFLGEPAGRHDVSLSLPSGVRVEGTIPGVRGPRILRVEYSRLSAKHRIRAWVRLLALTAQYPDRDWIAVTVGRGEGDVAAAGSFLGPASAEQAGTRLDELVAVYRLGLTRPLPLPPRTAHTYASRRRDGLNPDNALAFAGRQWRQQGRAGSWGEYDDADHRRCGLRTLQDLVAAAPVPQLGYDDEPHLFGQLARTVWTPLLTAEVTDP